MGRADRRDAPASFGASPFDGNVLFRERFRRTGLGAPADRECAFDGAALFDMADGFGYEFNFKNFFKKEFQQ